MNKIGLIILILESLYSCSDNSMNQNKVEHLRLIINKIHILKLPISFDSNNDQFSKSYYYTPDFNGLDSNFISSNISRIIGIFPDTTKYFVILAETIGDMLYPTIITFDKFGNKIDEQIINATGCAGHTTVDVQSCYDSVYIDETLKFKSESKVIGKVELNKDTILDICNVIKVNGYVRTDGKIEINRSNILNCK